MATGKLLKVAVIGTLVTALFSFTPLLVLALTALGLTALLGWLNVVLLPLFGIFVALTAYALLRRTRHD